MRLAFFFVFQVLSLLLFLVNMATARGTPTFICRAAYTSIRLRRSPQIIGRSLPNLQAWGSLPRSLPTTPTRFYRSGTARSYSVHLPRLRGPRGQTWTTRRVAFLTALTAALTYLYGAKKYAASLAPIRPKYGSRQEMENV
jgi:hypothetical protein